MLDFPAKDIENKWLEYWEEKGLFRTNDPPGKKFYNLMMFIYPSGDLHMGHCRNYVIGDVLFRFLKRRGFDVLHPFGWDAFGLPAENAAIERGVHPYRWTMENINTSRATIRKVGIGYDWAREVVTCEPDYYRWTQWMFLLMYRKGLAYRQEGYVNWCPGCQTVLANEQVVEGACERCDAPIEKRQLAQWYLRITAYAERLLDGLDRLDLWPDNVRTMQRNWIGRSEGCDIEFSVEGMDRKIKVFTTRPDTIYGVTFISIAPENLLVEELIRGQPAGAEVRAYVDRAIRTPEMVRSAAERPKDGIFTGRHAVNPLSGEKVPIFVADYVLAGYGSGIVMGVPAHDQRDFEFAKKYGLPIKVVINPPGGRLDPKTMSEAYVDQGTMTNSGPFDGLDSPPGIARVTQHLQETGRGGPTITYRLRDWLISRQRYWGAPIPMVYCKTCGVVPVPEEQLPVLLPPDVKDYLPKGQSPLAAVPGFVETRCPACGGEGRRETDTMDTFICSSWYFLRYLDPTNRKEFCRKEHADHWLPIDQYIGGITHATGHLIYFRFFTKVLFDAGFVGVDEPAQRLFTQGMVLKGGTAMSKSKGNIVALGPFVDEHGSDTARITILFAAPPEKSMEWSDEGVAGAQRFLNRVYRLVIDHTDALRTADASTAAVLSAGDRALYVKINQTIRKVTEDIQAFKFNTALAALMELLNELYKAAQRESPVFIHGTRCLVQLLSPLAPFLADEAWSKIGGPGSLLEQPWPGYDEQALTHDMQTVVVQINGRIRSKLEVPATVTEADIRELALHDEIVILYTKGKTIKKIVYVPTRLLSIATD